MAKGKLLLGLDIGSSGAKVCLMREVRGQYEVRTVCSASFPADTIVDGSILNASAATKVIKSLLSRNNIKQKKCAIAIAGYSVIVKRLRLSNMSDEDLDASLEWEVKQHIPYDISEVIYDKRVLQRNPEQGSMDILLVASKKEMVSEYIQVARNAGLEVCAVDVASFALQRMLAVSNPRLMHGCVGVVDVGASVLSMSIMSDGVAVFTRDITLGGNQITQEIQKTQSVTRDEAEAFKTGNIGSDSLIPADVNETIRQVSETIANEIKRSISFFYDTSGKDHLDKLILCGGALKNETTYAVIRDTLDVPVELADPFSGLRFNEKLYSKETLSDRALESAVSLGLALRRLDDDGINLDPNRKVKRKDGVHLMILGICVVVGLIALLLFNIAAGEVERDRESIQREINAKASQINEINGRIRDIASVERTLQELRKREIALAQLTSIRQGPQYVLNEISRLLSNPRDVVTRKEASESGWLLAWEPDNVMIRVFKDIGNGEIQLEGTARTMDDVYEFWTRLKTSKLLRNVELVEIKGAKDSGSEQVQAFMFRMGANFHYQTKEGRALIDELENRAKESNEMANGNV